MHDFVLQTENQVLISYYIQLDLFSESQYLQLKNLTDEKYWLQNYHLILERTELFSDLENAINTYLVPKKCFPTDTPIKMNRKLVYYEFYYDNLISRKSIIVAPTDMSTAIDLYLNCRFIEESILMAST